ncbi:hypothetical protein CAMRE0001_2118 [Campylobacter rectus RM3267]|uniref:Uncharacterized protein n=2 Tax=Campylobacter rectus TaxID=203 RepID=A0A6G5QLZ7_CAMRE|nr:hypothetical protein CAMRE0001_2118 [Campylobacter rectus RM3267]QCD46728.1 hypothetical protein CRECT_1063 [Campylobacter rectus]
MEKTISCESKFKITKIPDVTLGALAVLMRSIKFSCVFLSFINLIRIKQKQIFNFY